MEFSWNPNTKRTEKPQSSISMHPFLDVPSFSKISQPQVRKKKLVNSAVYHPCLQDYPQGCILSYFLKLVRVLSLSRMLVEFSLIVYSTMCGENFSICGVHIPRKCIESIHIYSCPSPPLKTSGGIFWKSVSPKPKWVEETMIFFIKSH